MKKINNVGIKKHNSYFDYYKGHRVDEVNHNWILFNEYISLSFSFMTFVIRGRGQDQMTYLAEDYVFDQEEYDFIINRKTCFTCDSFVGNDFEKLSYVLGKMKELNPILLQQLHYYYLENSSLTDSDVDEMTKSSAHMKIIDGMTSMSKSLVRVIIDEDQETNEAKKICPLHLAFKEGNNRSINIILRYMSMLDNNCCDTIRDILPELIEYENFILYMRKLPFQTNQMINKQTLKM